MRRLWRALATHAVATFCPTGVVALDIDDTLFHRAGRKVDARLPQLVGNSECDQRHSRWSEP
jgi:hypothetical protein